MNRSAGVWMLLAALGGCTSIERTPDQGSCGCSGGIPQAVPNVQGPWGAPVPQMAAYAPPPSSAMTTIGPWGQKQTSARSESASGVVQAGYTTPADSASNIMQASGSGGPNGCAPGGNCPPPYPKVQTIPVMPPPPGQLPIPQNGMGPPGAVAAMGVLPPLSPSRFPTCRTSVRFLSPAGMSIAFYAPNCESKSGFGPNQVQTPGRYNFAQAAIYRLKVSNIPNRPGVELYPTLEVVPSSCKTDAFLAHSTVPVAFTEEDFEQVAAGNYVVKVIYLPDPQYQDLATTVPDEVVSSRLEPGVDPIAEAKRRGSVLLVVRVGNIDLEAPNTPAMDAPPPYHGPCAPGMPCAGAMGPGGPMGMGAMAGRGPAGPMTMTPPPVGQVMMTPNGPMMMTPNGPMPMGPNGALMANPATGSAPTVPTKGSGGAMTYPVQQPGAMAPSPGTGKAGAASDPFAEGSDSGSSKHWWQSGK